MLKSGNVPFGNSMIPFLKYDDLDKSCTCNGSLYYGGNYGFDSLHYTSTKFEQLKDFIN